jgi:hypothetical protein
MSIYLNRTRIDLHLWIIKGVTPMPHQNYPLPARGAERRRERSTWGAVWFH